MVRLLYVYKDGRTYRTEVMLRSEALAYMTVLKAQATTPDRYVASFGVIYFEEV